MCCQLHDRRRRLPPPPLSRDADVDSSHLYDDRSHLHGQRHDDWSHVVGSHLAGRELPPPPPPPLAATPQPLFPAASRCMNLKSFDHSRDSSAAVTGQLPQWSRGPVVDTDRLEKDPVDARRAVDNFFDNIVRSAGLQQYYKVRDM